MENDSGVVYNSGIVIDDSGITATLSVLYDEVFLPYYDIDALESYLQVKDVPVWRRALQDYRGWEAYWNPLFQERVLALLPKPPGPLHVDALDLGIQIDSYLARWIDEPDPDAPLSPLSVVNALGIHDWLPHINRKDITLPRIFDVSCSPNRPDMIALEAFSAFRYVLPRLNALEPDEILELRRKVRDTREGFTMHLQKLSKGLDGMVKSGENLKDLSGYAQGIVETELIPDYREFHRQLAAENAGKLRKVLDVTGKIMEIDAAPWTPKFWGLLLKALGMSAIETAADQKERLTNRYQAFEFMKTIESFDQRKRGQ